MYLYYENGTKEKLSLSEVKKLFETTVDNEQKEQGTTFETWLDEMEKMQILNKVEV